MGEAIVGLAAIYLATIVVYWFALMIFIGWVASQKGRSGGGWFFLAFFFNVYRPDRTRRAAESSTSAASQRIE